MDKALSKVYYRNYILYAKFNERICYKMDVETPSNDSHLYKVALLCEYV